MILKKLLVYSLYLCSLICNAQVIITGQVSPIKNAKGLSVTLKDTYDGTTIDEKGFFKFETSEKGALQLDVSNSYYIIVSKDIVVQEEDLNLQIDLGANYQVVDGVVINRNLQNSLPITNEVFNEAVDVYTTPGASGSITKALGFLPGVQNVNDREGLFIRGGSQEEAKVFIDGVLVNDYFSSGLPGIGGVDQFSAGQFKKFDFSNGGYSAVYGQALSGVLNLETTDLVEDSRWGVGVTPGSLSGTLQLLNDPKNLNIGFSAAYSNLSIYKNFIQFNNVFEKYPETYTLSPSVKYKLSTDVIIKYLGRVDNRDMEVLYADRTLGIDQTNNFHSLSLNRTKVTNRWDLGVNYSKNNKKFYSNMTDANLELSTQYVNSAIRYNGQFVDVLEFNLGANFNLVEENKSYKQQAFFYKENRYALFSEFLIPVLPRVVLNAGMRAEYSSFISKNNLAPRLNLRYSWNESTDLSFRYGLYFQSPLKDFVVVNQSDLTFQRNNHYILAYHYKNRHKTVRIEGFYMQYNHLPTGILRSDTYVIDGFQGKGYAKGIELLWKDSKPRINLDYWISYSFLDAERKYLNFPKAMSPDFSSKHSLAFVAKKMFLEIRTQMNLSYSYNSGRPYYNIINKGIENSLKEVGVTKKIDQINFGINHLPNLGKKNKKVFPVINFNINNVLATNTILGYRYSDNGLSSTAILPFSKVFYSVALFLEFGVNREEDMMKQL